MLRLLAFDLDDTLYPERSYIRGGFKEVSNYMHQEYDLDAKEFYKKLLYAKSSMPSSHIIDIVLDQYKLLDKKLVEKLIEKYRSQPLKLRLYPGVKSVLSALKKKYILALITDGSQVVQYKKLYHLKIVDLFDTFIYTLDLEKGSAKPSHLPFKKILELYEIEPQEALYIGNNPDKDFIGARKAGLKTVRVNQGFYKGKNIEKKLDADITIKSIKELLFVVSLLEKSYSGKTVKSKIRN